MRFESLATQRPFENIQRTLIERFPGVNPYFQGLTPDVQTHITDQLAQVDVLTRDPGSATLPFALQENFTSVVEASLSRIMTDERKDPTKRVKDALRFTRALKVLGTNYARAGELTGQPLAIESLPTVRRVSGRIWEAEDRLMKSLPDGQVKLALRDELLLTQVRLMNHIAPTAIGYIDAAFQGETHDETLLHQAGVLLHDSSELNLSMTKNSAHFSQEQREVVREAAITQHLALMENDLLGYHGDTSVATAEETVFHARRIIDELYSEPKEKIRLVVALEQLAKHIIPQMREITSETVTSISASQSAALVSMREIDELMLELAAPGSGGYAQASERLAHTYDLLGRYHESTGDREAAFSDYKNVCQLRVEQNKIPPDNALFGVVRLLRERSSELPLEERVKMWELNTYHRLRPRNSSGFYEKESQQLACEIALLEEQRAAGGFAEQTALHRRVAAVVYTVEEPSETSIGLLNLLNDEKEQKPATSEGQQPSAAEDLQRVNEIATFLGKGGKDHLSDNFRYNDPLSLYKREKLQGSYVAIDHLRQGLQESGTIHPEAAIRTSHAAVRVMVKRPFGERVIGADEPAFIAGLYRYKQSPDDESAAPIVPKPVETVPIDQARIQLDEAFARQLGLPVDPTVQETLLAFPESFHLSKQDIQVAEGVAFIPVVRAPGSWVEQPKFHLMLTTGSDARTLVFKEGKCIGSFITTSDHPTIALEESKQGSGTSFLWEPNLPSSMSAEERKKHGGDLVGTLQLITMPIVIDKGRDGGGKTSIVPVPSEGPKLLPVETHFASREGEDSLLTWRAMIAAVMAGMKEGSVAKPSLKMVESTASRLYSSDSFSSFTRGAVYSSPLRFSGVLASPPLGPMKPSRPARAERREATLATERVAIGTSRTQGSGYGTFTDEIRPDTTKPVSLMRISLIGVSPENMDEIEVK